MCYPLFRLKIRIIEFKLLQYRITMGILNNNIVQLRDRINIHSWTSSKLDFIIRCFNILQLNITLFYNSQARLHITILKKLTGCTV